MDDEFLTPLKSYNHYKEIHKQNVEEYFNDLEKKANVDVEANKATISKYKAALSIANKTSDSISGYKKRKKIIVYCIILLWIVAIIVLFKVSNLFVKILMILLMVASIIYYSIRKKQINQKQKVLEGEFDKQQKVVNSYKMEAWGQMVSLNALFEEEISSKLFSKTLPIIEMDEYLDNNVLARLKKYGFYENTDVNRSTLFVDSGTILGNPFALVRYKVQEWRNHTYTGSIVIHWTTTEHTKDGTKTHHHSEVLSASVTKPEPYYYNDTRLYYGCEAAPNLKFSRGPSGIKPGMTDKEFESFVKKSNKELEKKENKALKEGKNFTRMGNDEFEALFNSTDRSDEVQFRLLYTPIAQDNIIKLLRTGLYGDDFYQYKNKMLNTIISRHSQNFDYTDNPLRYVGFDFEEVKRYFIDYNMKYFDSLYFDFAPLMSIPLYQQTKSQEYIYKDDNTKNFVSNITSYEQEEMANSFDVRSFRHRLSDTQNILKSYIDSTDGKVDKINVKSYGYQACKRVSYFQRRGGDGHTHTVPVYWIEYIPVIQTTPMCLSKKDSSRMDFNAVRQNDGFSNLMKTLSNNYLYRRGMFATVGKMIGQSDFNKINEVYKDKAETEELKKKMFKDAAILTSIIVGEKMLDDENENIKSNDKDFKNFLEDDKIEAKEVETKED